MINNSPVKYAKSIEVPILLIHGECDDICQYKQSTLMSEALKKAKKPHALVKFKEEGHGLGMESRSFEVTLKEKFLHKVLGGNFESLSPEEKKSKSQHISIVRDTTGFFKDF